MRPGDDDWYLLGGVWHRDDGVRLARRADHAAWSATRLTHGDLVEVLDLEADSAFAAMDEVDARWPFRAP